MSTQTVTTLKTYFNTGDYPNESQFHDLIDSNLNLTDGGTVVGATTMTGQLSAQNATNYLGLHKFQGFAGTLANTNAASVTYTQGDVLVELGTLDTTVPEGFVAATKFFFTEFAIGITTQAGAVLGANLSVSATSGTATNSAISSGTEVCGAGVGAFNPFKSVQETVNAEIDIALNNSAGTYHIFTPYVNAAIASKYLYVVDQQGIGSGVTGGKFTVAAKYSVY
tara:strand:- start:104 stop:775 length:672 start_codon:yes stop_codon:yes gene_type:complete